MKEVSECMIVFGFLHCCTGIMIEIPIMSSLLDNELKPNGIDINLLILILDIIYKYKQQSTSNVRALTNLLYK